jgi:uncharacterized repeat protein (TIGR01451 family)
VALGLAAGPAAAQTVDVTVGDLESDGSITIEIVVTVDNPVPAGLTEVCNQGTVSGANFDPDVLTDDPAEAGGADPTCTDVVATPDLTIAKGDGGGSVAPGGTVAYTLTYQNVGNQGATGVVISELVPANTTFNAGASTAGWSCADGSPAGTPCALAVGLLAGGGGGGVATFAVTVVNPAPSGLSQISNTASIADDAANGADPTPANNSATDTTPVDAAPDLTVAKDDGGATAVPGGTVAYTLTYSNVGNQDGAGVVLSELVPANTTFNAGASTAGWSCADGSPAGTPCALAVGPLAGGGGGGSATFAVTVANPVAAGVGEISNTGTIADDGTNGADPTPANNSSTDTTPVDAVPDLTVAKSDGGATAVPGGTVAYTLTYQNVGNQGASGVALSELVPANTTFNAGASTAGWSCADGSPAGTPCALAVGLLAGGGGGGLATFAVTVVNPVAAGVDQISNTGTIADDAGNGADPTPANNSSTDTTPVDAAPDLTLAKSYAGPTPLPGATIAFDLDYDNSGNQGATGVVISETVPPNTTFNAAASTAGWTCADGSPAGTPCDLAIGALAGGGAGGSAVFAVDLDDPLPPGVNETENCASVDDDAANGADPNPGDNDDCFTVGLDSVPPTVENVDAVAPTDGGTLAECETVRAAVTGFTVAFSEPMFNPAADGGGSVTDPGNYLLVGPGPDFDFATTGCGGAAGDDLAVAVTGVTYDGGSNTATLAVGGALANSQYRLFVCGTLTDTAGNLLDGDDDGDAGGDFEVGFRADRGNRFANGHFDCDLGGWTATTATAGEIAWDDADADGADDSGSAGVTNLMPAIDTTFSLAQCLAVAPAVEHDFTARLRLDAAVGVSIGLVRSCQFFSGPACAGSLGTASFANAFSDTAGTWLALAEQITPPAGAVAARCTIRFETPTGESFDAFLDRVVLTGPDLIFADGFESGDTSAWSSCVGCPP